MKFKNILHLLVKLNIREHTQKIYIFIIFS